MKEKQVFFTKWIDSLEDDEDKEVDSFDQDEDWNFTKKLITNKVKSGRNIFISNLGIIPLGNTLASHQNKIWIGHTNFQLTKTDQNKCIKIDGVEAWKCLTPYRFSLIVGWLFNDEDVQKNIRLSLCEIKDTSFSIKNIHGTFPFWISIKLKNGKKDVIGGNNKEDIKNKMACREDIDTILDKSWKLN